MDGTAYAALTLLGRAGVVQESFWGKVEHSRLDPREAGRRVAKTPEVTRAYYTPRI